MSAGLCPSIAATTSTDTVILEAEINSPGDIPPTDTQSEPNPTPPTPPAPQPFRDPFLVTAAPSVTLADIAAFRPAAAVAHAQPGGWTVRGLHTNLFATGGGGVVDGVLLGLPASVRFTPVAWHWEYGDGATAAARTPGASWAALGLAEFDPTPTSHVYRTPGAFTVDLSVDYAAEYRFAGGSWIRIDGIVTLPANPLAITVGEAATVLVRADCGRSGRGAGC